MLKDIFLYADNNYAAFKPRLEAAVNLAAAHQSHVTGVYVPSFPKEHHARHWSPSRSAVLVLPKDSRDRKAVLKQQVASDVYERIRFDAEKAQDMFTRQCERAGVVGEWIYDEEPLLDALALNARFCDVLIISQPTAKDITERLITTLELPVLMIPNKGRYPNVGQRILVAWDRSPVALRAVNNARPLLRLAAEVKILSVDLESVYRGAAYGSGIVEHMDRHGIKAERLRVKSSKDARLSEVILETATKEKSDLIVMGAYGNRGLRERFLGGVTSNVISDTAVPLLLTH